MSPLDKKLVRDLRSMGGQVVTIGLVVACGIAAFVALRSTYHSLRESQDAYYERYRFADVFATLERAPEALGERLESIPGVATVHTRISDVVRLPMPGMSEPATGLVVSVPAGEAAPLNDVFLRAGRRVAPGRDDEVMVLEAFAEAHGLSPGDHLEAIVNGAHRDLTVVGTAMSPEYVFAMQPGDMAADNERFAILWMDREAMAPLFDMEGAFDDVAVRLQPGASEPAVKAALDDLLEPYGSRGSVGRSRQMSHFILEQEMMQLENMATTAPTIFLLVAAFLLHIVLSRTIGLQRSQIAALKALGYADRDIGLHYLKLVLLIVLLGSVVGVSAGAWLGREFTELYTRFFRFPVLLHQLDLAVVVQGIGVSALAGTIGALSAVRGVVKLPPAEAMRPPPPARYRATLVDRLPIFKLLGQASRMVLREARRRPVRLLLSSVGIAFAVGIVVVGRFFADAMEYLVEDYMHQAQREDVAVSFTGPVPDRAARELAHLPGVTYVEALRSVPARVRSGHRQRDTVLMGYGEERRLRRLVDRRLRVVDVPDGGIALTRTLGEILDVGVGDEVDVQVLEGNRVRKRLVVAGLVDELMGLQGHMTLHALGRLMREQGAINMAVLDIDPARYTEVRERLGDMPAVASITRMETTVETFREQSGEQVRVFSLILAVFAAIIAIGVVYNNARVSLSMKARDLGSLRVLGFTRAEISAVLLGELALQVLLAIPLGLWLGREMSEAMISQTDPEVYRLPAIISPATYAFAVFVILVAAIASALLVRRKLDRLDLIAVLKTRE